MLTLFSEHPHDSDSNASDKLDVSIIPSQSNAAKTDLVESGLPEGSRLEDFEPAAQRLTSWSLPWGQQPITNAMTRGSSQIVRDLIQRAVSITDGADISVCDGKSDAAKDDLRLPTKMTMRFNIVKRPFSSAAWALHWINGNNQATREMWMHSADFGLNALGDIPVDDETELVNSLGTELASILEEGDVPKEWKQHGEGDCGGWKWESQVGPDHTNKSGPGGLGWQVCLSQSSDV